MCFGHNFYFVQNNYDLRNKSYVYCASLNHRLCNKQAEKTTLLLNVKYLIILFENSSVLFNKKVNFLVRSGKTFTNVGTATLELN